MERLRYAGPNERRCIVRQALDYYRTLVVGGIYTFNGQIGDISLKSAFVKALKHCVSVHPILSAVIIGEDTEAPAFARPPILDLENHVELIKSGQTKDVLDERSLIKLTLAQTNDHIFMSRDQTPPWKIVVVPLPARDQIQKNRCLILFAYYHSHGDGKSGLAFHKNLLSGLRLSLSPDCPYTIEKECTTPSVPLLPTMEMAGKLDISWSFLLSLLLGAYLPSFISGPLGIRASATPEAENQWRGRNTSHDSNDFCTGVEIVYVDNNTLRQTIQKCRAHKVKFTGLLHQLIVRALSEVLPPEQAGSFVSATAVDLRKHLSGITEKDMALCPTAYYELFPRTTSSASQDWATSISQDPLWLAARTTTQGLARCADTLNDQPVGLLRYLRTFYPWMKGQIGKRRECSYELSNIPSFKPDPSELGDKWDVESMIFSQPANATSGALCFNVVTRYKGELVLVISWQMGALDVEDEQEFVGKIGASISASMETLGKVQA